MIINNIIQCGDHGTICKMNVDEKSAQYKTEYNGKIYYFCAAACRDAFEANPKKYLKEKPWWKFW